MGHYILRRVIATIPILLIVSIATFLLMYLIFGDPAVFMLASGEGAVDEQTLERLREQLGVNRPLPVRYGDWLANVLQGDLGRSFRSPIPVTDLLTARLPVTLELAFLSLGLSVLMGIPLGVIAATRPGSKLDLGLSSLAVISLSMPNFWLGIVLIFFFALKLGWMPSSGHVPFTDSPIDNLKHMLLPSLTLAAAHIGNLARYTRTMTVDVLAQDYVRTARAKGLLPRTIMMRHCLRNTLIPIVTIIGLQLAGMFSGAVVTETVFSLPGVGTLLIDSIFGRDMPVVQGTLIVVTTSVIAINLVVDLLYGVLDPRIRVS